MNWWKLKGLRDEVKIRAGFRTYARVKGYGAPGVPGA